MPAWWPATHLHLAGAEPNFKGSGLHPLGCWCDNTGEPLAGMLRQGPAGDQFAGWPAAMRVFARRERPHPGAQLTLFEAEDGWRYSLWVTNLPGRTRGWRGQLAYIDAAHRVHARVEDAIRTGKDCGLGRFPSYDFGINSAWLTASPDRRDPAVLAAAHRPGRRPRPRGAQDPALPDPARIELTGEVNWEPLSSGR
jgi:hypothetical protein